MLQVPKHGVFTDHKQRTINRSKRSRVLQNVFAIGGERGWYYGNWLWHIRGVMDKVAGGIGLRRGRTNPIRVSPGDALDFWRVLVADEKRGRLLLFAEMKLPGDAWLEFTLLNEGDQSIIKQTATFRPNGLMGRLYWYSVLPFHVFIFNGMINNIVKYPN